MNILALGDIHTKTCIIDAATKLVDHYDAIVFVGDYADDWDATPMRSLETWQHLKSFQSDYPDKVHILAGNHDYIYAHKTSSLQSGYSYATQMLLNSPENKALKDWLRDLPITIKLDGVTYSHAGLTVSYTDGNELWDDRSPLWARPGREEYQDIPQIFGHTPSKTCWEVQPNVWCIDTFSTHQDGTPVGDQTVLEIVDGKEFNIKALSQSKEIDK